MKYLLVLLCCAFLAAPAARAQVGVNQAKPEQTLDVNGKIKVGDDAAIPTDGTVRYNAAEGDFEGRTGGNWKSFTQAGGVPYVNAEAFGGAVTVARNANANLRLFPLQGNGASLGDTPPAGKIFVVTHMAPAITSFDATSRYSILVQRISGLIFAQAMFLNCQSADCPATYGDPVPLMILEPGDVIRVTNNSFSSGSVRLGVRGFLVDALDY